MIKSVCIAYAHGCIRSEAEIELLAQYFTANGLILKDEIGDAELVLISVCGFDLCAEATSMKLLRRAFQKKGETAQLAVIGCLPAINRKVIDEAFGDQVLLFPAQQLGKLDEFIGASVPFKEVLEKRAFSHAFVETDIKLKPAQLASIKGLSLSYNPRARRAFSRFERLTAALSLSKATFDKVLVRIPQCLRLQFVRQTQDVVPALLLSRGCQGLCTFCGIPLAVGPLRSLPLETIVNNFKAILDQGNRLVSLIATDVGAYGQDCGLSVVELLKRLFAEDGDFQLILNDFNPRWLIKYSDELIPLLAENAEKIDYILMPIQSGSEKILELMLRGHTAAGVRESFKALKRAVPGIKVGTHVLVGFPGETEADFGDTVELLHELDFYYLKVFKYDDRPGIKAAKLPEKVSDKVKRRRLLRLLREFPGLVK